MAVEWPGDFVSNFVAFSEEVKSPHLFKLWSAIAMTAIALERRVWARTRHGAIYPNLYVALIAPPGIGKAIINTARELLEETLEPGTRRHALHIGADSMTSASLMDEMVKAKELRIVPDGPPLVYHSLAVVQEELQIFLPAFSPEMMGRLNGLWVNKLVHRETRRTGSVKELVLEAPQLSLLVGAQPSYLASTFPEEAWSTGLARRLVMVYSSETKAESLWGESHSTTTQQRVLLGQLGQFSARLGLVRWTTESADEIDRWQLSSHQPGVGGEPVPTHSKLAHYNRSRTEMVIKLAIVSALSRTGRLVIELVDVKRAVEWLTEAEAHMPDVFREMVGKSDKQVIDETHLFIMSLYGRAKKNVPGERIMDFLLGRVPVEKAKLLMDAMERANIIARVAGTQDLWVPKPRIEHSAEE